MWTENWSGWYLTYMIKMDFIATIKSVDSIDIHGSFLLIFIFDDI